MFEDWDKGMNTLTKQLTQLQVDQLTIQQRQQNRQEFQ
jgi:hypothetical protein